MRKKLIYWLTQETSPRVTQLIKVLANWQIETTVFRGFQQLLDEFAKVRTNMIVISDEGSAAETESWIRKLALSCEFKGTRYVLSVTNPTPALMKLAYDNDFKDIIPADLSDEAWLRRFLFSMATSPAHLKHPTPQLTLQEEAQIAIPAKVVWLATSTIRLETRIRATVGEPLALGGPIAASLGMKQLSLKVRETISTDLFYRFSEGMVCTMELTAPHTQSRYNMLLDHLHKQDRGLACKIFLVIKSPEIRRIMLDHLRDPRFEPLTAISQKSIVTEPRYFNPDIVFIESELFRADHIPMFKKMFHDLKKDTPVVFIGKANKDEIAACTNQIRNKVFQLAAVGPDLADSILDKFLHQKRFTLLDAPTDAIMLGKDNEFTTAEIMMPAILTRIHPEFASLAVPTPLGNYGLCRVESTYFRSALNAPVFGKLTGSSFIPKETTSQTPERESYQVDLSLSCMAQEKERIGKAMLYSVMRHLRGISEMGLDTPENTVAVGAGTGAAVSDTLASPSIGGLSALRAEVFAYEKETESTEPASLGALADVFVRGSKSVLQTVKKPSVRSWINVVGIILTFVIFSFMALYGTYYYFEKVAQTYHRSGKEYTNQLEKFRDQ